MAGKPAIFLSMDSKIVVKRLIRSSILDFVAGSVPGFRILFWRHTASLGRVLAEGVL